MRHAEPHRCSGQARSAQAGDELGGRELPTAGDTPHAPTVTVGLEQRCVHRAADENESAPREVLAQHVAQGRRPRAGLDGNAPLAPDGDRPEHARARGSEQIGRSLDLRAALAAEVEPADPESRCTSLADQGRVRAGRSQDAKQERA
jgi:hypothetical protein